MKKAIVLIVLIASFCLMGGCLQETPLTDEELDVVAEYAASLLLKYDANYDTYYLPIEKLQPTELPEATPTTDTPFPEQPTPVDETHSTGGDQPTKTPDASPVPTQPLPTPTLVPENSELTDEQLTNVIDVDDLRVRYDTYDLYKSYNSNSYYTLEAKEGRQYLIVKFQIENISNRDINLCLSDEKYLYSLYLNVTTMFRPTFTMEVNDIHFLGTKDSPYCLTAGDTLDAILVFDIPDNDLIDSAHLTIMNADNHETVFIKLK